MYLHIAKLVHFTDMSLECRDHAFNRYMMLEQAFQDA